MHRSRNEVDINKQAYVSSRWYILKCGYGTKVLYEDDRVHFKYSKVLEEWIDIFIDDKYSGTIPVSEFKREFRTYAAVAQW